jgi:hypothetical protein
MITGNYQHRDHFLVAKTPARTAAIMTMMMTRVDQERVGLRHVIRLTADEQAPPLLAVTGSRLFNSASNFLVALNDVVVDFLALLLNVLDEGLLLHNNLVEILEELGKLHHLSLNLLNRLVSFLDVPKT